MTVVPPLQSFELFETETEAFLTPPFRSRFGGVVWGEPRSASAIYEYLIKGLIPRGELVLIYGASQSGKSFFTQELSMSVSRGIPFFGRKSRPGLVIYCAAEAGVGFANLRMPAYGQHHALPMDERLPFVCLTRKFDLFGNEDEVKALIAEILHYAGSFDVPLEAVVIDTLNKTTPGMDEIHGKDVGIVLKRLDMIREACRCGLWLVHHKNSAGTGPRGHTSLLAAFETAIEVSRTNEKDHDSRPIRTAKIAKQREGEDGSSFRFVLRQVEVGRDVDGDPMTSCIVAPPSGSDGQPAAQTGYRPSSGDAIVMKAMIAALNASGVTPSPLLGLPPSILKVVDYEHVKVAYRDLNPDDGNDIDKWKVRLKKGLQRGRERLHEYGIIGVASPFVWLTGKPIKGFGGVTRAAPDQEAPSPGMEEVMNGTGDINW